MARLLLAALLAHGLGVVIASLDDGESMSGDDVDDTNDTTTPSAAPVPSPAPGFRLADVHMAAGTHFSLFVDVSDSGAGSAWAMGRNQYGQLGLGNESGRQVNVPQQVVLPAGVRVSDVAAGKHHSLFLLETGAVFGAGCNNYGQLGGSAAPHLKEPEQIYPVAEGVIAPGDKAVAVAAGGSHSLILLADGRALSVGGNHQGQVGDGTTTHRSSWHEAAQGVKAIAAGYDFSYFLTEAGDVMATGQNLGGQLGDGTFATKHSPVKVLVGADSGKVTDVSAGQSHGLFLMEDGKVLGTGANFLGQLGLGSDTAPTNQPKEMASDKDYKATLAVAGGDSSAYVCEQGRLWVTGSNVQYQIGLGERTSSVSTPVVDMDVRGYMLGASIGAYHSILVSTKDHGTVWSSGANSYGEIGDGKPGEARPHHVPIRLMDIPGVTTSTPQPTPQPTPAPTPEATRSPGSEGGGSGWLIWVGGGFCVIGAIGGVMFVLKQGKSESDNVVGDEAMLESRDGSMVELHEIET